MSGIEVIMLVSGIVGAYASAASYLQGRKKRKAEKAKDKRQDTKRRLKFALNAARPQIQHEYDMLSAKLGAIFAAGDPIARKELNDIWQDMQRCIDSTFEQRRANPFATHLNYASLLEVSERSKVATINSLIGQFQRLWADAPIVRDPSYPYQQPQPLYSMSATPLYTLSTREDVPVVRASAQKSLTVPPTSSDDSTSSTFPSAPNGEQAGTIADLATPNDTPVTMEHVDVGTDFAPASPDDLAISTIAAASDDAQTPPTTELSTHVDMSLASRHTQEGAAISVHVCQSFPVNITSTKDPASSKLSTLDDVKTNAPMELPVTSSFYSGSTRSASSLGDLVPAELSATPWRSGHLEKHDFYVDLEVPTESMSTEQSDSSTDKPAPANVPTEAESETIESNRSVAKKAVTTLEMALAIHNYLLPETSAIAPENTAFTQYITNRLHASVSNLAHGAKGLTQMTNELTPPALRASSEAQGFKALIEDEIAATHKLIAYGERLMLEPKWDMEYTSREHDYWFDQIFYPW